MLAAKEIAMYQCRQPARVYTADQKAALVGEIQQRQRTEGRGIDELARELGIRGYTYYNWLRAGVRPQAPAPTPPPAAATPSRVKGARHYPASERAALLAEVARRCDDGERIGAVLTALDLGRTTYARWREQAAPPLFRAVTLAGPAPAVTALALVPATPLAYATTTPVASLVLVTPGGYRIEGLVVESAAALLKALS